MNHKKENWYKDLMLLFKNFIDEATSMHKYKIVDMYKCEKTGFTEAVIKLSERHVTRKDVKDIIMDDDLLDNLDAKTIRALTYIATIENLKPDCSIVAQHMTGSLGDYILEIKDKSTKEAIKKSAYELSSDKKMISRFDSVDANRIGYLAGINATAKFSKNLQNKNECE